MSDSPNASVSDSSAAELPPSRGIGRRRFPPWWVLAVGAVVIVVGVAMALRAGGGSPHRAFPKPGEVVEAFDADALRVSSISDFTIGADDTMFVAVHDEDHHRSLLKVTPGGSVSTLIRTTGKNAAEATALALGQNGELFIADPSHDRVIARARNGTIRQIGSYAPAAGAADTDPGLGVVRRMTLDPETGDLYLADQYKIDRLDSKGQLSTVAGARRRYDDKRDFPADTFVPHASPPNSGAAKAMRFFSLEGVAFDPGTDNLYAVTGLALVRIGKDGQAQTIPSDVEFRSNVVFDAVRKSLYAGAKSEARDGIARVNQQGDVVVLSGTEEASSIADRIGTDSRGNVYWLHEGSGSLEVAGDALSETRIDLKGKGRQRMTASAASPRSKNSSTPPP